MKKATGRNKSAEIHGKRLKEPKTLKSRKMTRWKTVPRSSTSAARFVNDRIKNKEKKKGHLKTAPIRPVIEGSKRPKEIRQRKKTRTHMRVSRTPRTESSMMKI